VLNLIFAQFSPQALKSIGVRYFYALLVFNMIAMVCYIFFYPGKLSFTIEPKKYLLTSSATEKGKTLEQTDELFGDQLVPHALEDPKGAAIAMEKNNIIMHEEVTRE
jgi:hypothetical protein